MVKINYLEECFKNTSYFLDESVFEPEYIPERVKYRESELILLSKIFLPLIKNPNNISKKVIITGNVGVGKTITVHIFKEMLLQSAEKRKINIKVVYINCRHNRTGYLILSTIINNLITKIPRRGLSPGELLKILLEYLKKTNTHLLIILDELNFIQKRDTNLIYTLTRINELKLSDKNYISLIGIVKDLISLNNFDSATLSTLESEIIKFKKYNKTQIIEILRDRVEIGVKPNVVDDEILEMIADITLDTGDMRRALNILKNSIKYAENKFLPSVTVEAVRHANAEFIPMSIEDLFEINKHELLLFKAIVNVFMHRKTSKILLSEIHDEYILICKEYNERPRSNTQLWDYINDLKIRDLISSKVKNKNVRGKQSFIYLNNYSPRIINDQIENVLRNWRSPKNVR